MKIDWQGRRKHGTRSSYSGGCRCDDCRRAQAEGNTWYERRKAAEAWGAVPPLLVDAEPSRRHVQILAASGMGYRRIAAESGLSPPLIQRLYGWNSDRPALKVRPETEAKLLAVQPGNLAPSMRVSAGPAGRKVRALIAAGYPRTHLARRLGILQQNFNYADYDDSHTLTVRHDQAISAMYDELCATPGGSVRARNEGQRKGWPPPLAWDDIDAGILADDTDPGLCHVCEDVEHLAGTTSWADISARVGLTMASLARHLGRHGHLELANACVRVAS